MTGRLKLIEQQLIGLDSAAFQNLCDIYISFKESEITSFNRTGSQLGKQKTVKGTPDTFYRLKDGGLRYVEFTTKSDGLVTKVKDDIDKCLDVNLTGVPPHEVSRIQVFFNSRLNVEDETTITKYAITKRVPVDLVGLDILAIEIYSKYLILAKDILGLPLDTGQILPLSKFVEEYNNKGGKLSTPLDNTFLHRVSELAEIEAVLKRHDLIVITGFPGVGKTKIALEAVETFLVSNPDFEAYAIATKDADIAEDLRIHLQKDKKYVLLIDDANRQILNLKQILGIFKERRSGDFKMVLTVRDYAYEDIIKAASDLESYKLVLEKFTDEEIVQLIENEPFNIKNEVYQSKIVDVSGGNARLAIMAARIANEEQHDFLIGGVYELYDVYFQSFIRESDVFTSKTLLQTLGLISFFFTINRYDKVFIKELLDLFEIDYHAFHESIDELEKRELVEIQFDHVRVSEQIVGTYFFYKTFIEDRLLSFKNLLFKYYEKWGERFSDTIIPSNNSFGYANVFGKINPSLNEYLQSIKDDEKATLNFFTRFWFYKQDETLAFFFNRIKLLPEPSDPIYDTDYGTNDFVWDNDETIKYLAEFLRHDTDNFNNALELAFEYCRKYPPALPELIRRIKERVLFEYTDSQYGFPRQMQLFEHVIDNVKKDKMHYVRFFAAVCPTFLSHHFKVNKTKMNKVYFGHYSLYLDSVISEFRKNIWNTIDEKFDSYPDLFLSVIADYNWGIEKAIPEIIDFDLNFLVPLIKKHLDNQDFKHIYVVQNLVRDLDRERITDLSYQNLSRQYISKQFELFKLFDWRFHRDPGVTDRQSNDDAKAARKAAISQSFLFNDPEEFPVLQETISNFLSVEKDQFWCVQESLNVILESNFEANNELGFLLLNYVLQNYPPGAQPYYSVIEIIANKSNHWAERLWFIINDWDNENSIYWKLMFFYILPEKFVDQAYCKSLIKTIESIDRPVAINFKHLEKFFDVKMVEENLLKRLLSQIPIVRKFSNEKENVFVRILNIVNRKVELEELNIGTGYDFFETYSNGFAIPISLMEDTYLLQEKLNNGYDYGREGLKTLVVLDHRFLIRYIKAFYSSKTSFDRIDTHNRLPFVWDLDNYESLVEETVDTIIENNFSSGFLEHPIGILFKQLETSQLLKAKDFLTKYVSKNYLHSERIRAVFELLRGSMADFHDELMLIYLNCNPGIKNFEKINWIGNGGMYSGDVIIGQVNAEKWSRLLSVVKRADDSLEIIPITAYIKAQIEYQLSRGEEEKIRKFINPRGW